MYYSDEIIEEVLSRNDIVDVINSYTSLKRKGNNYEACCPFHHEKTPSFKVSREKQMYHCFGCGVGGNVFTFVMEYENLSFPEAVEQLASRAGITLPEKNESASDRAKEQYRMTLKEINRSAAAYFHYILRHSEHGKRAYDYFKGRGLSDETIDKFALGYSDIYKDDLYKYLRNKGYTDEQLRESGLVSISEKEGGTDKFWNRAMIPILDINGKVIAFGGRVLGDGKPKYINTSDTPVFDKSHNLFAMNIARRSRRKGFICCEGYMDVISMHQAGFDNAVASLGTAFTFGHANIIKRYANEVYLAYDSDEAGVAATLKVIDILREVGVSARVINMKPYKDPDELIQALGSEGFEERVNSAESAMMFEASVLSERYNQNDPGEKTKFQNELARKLSVIDDVLERSNYIDAVSNKYNIDRDALKEKVHAYGIAGIAKPEVVEREERRNEAASSSRMAENKTAKLLLTWLVNEPSLFEKLEGIIDENDFEDGIYRVVAKKLFEQYNLNGKVEPAVIINIFETLEEQHLVAEMLQTDLRIDMTESEIDAAITDVVRKIKLNSIETELSHTNDIVRMQQLIKDKANISKLNIMLCNG
ncbi:MAG: DNA primase [Coprococcus sp.]